MNNNNSTICKTGDTSKLVRPRFGPGMLLQHEDLEQLGSYTRELSRLLFRSFFGCGVVCGLTVDAEMKCGKVSITVGAGLALACSGDPVHVPKDKTFTIDDKCEEDLADPFYVVLCGTTKCCAPRTSMCATDDDEAHSVCTRERDGYEICITATPPECVCRCPDPENGGYGNEEEDRPCQCVDPNSACYRDHYAGKCGCSCGECSDCDCKCILLARVEREGDTDRWITDYHVRRFIRPLLMRDPLTIKRVVPQDQGPDVALSSTAAKPAPPPFERPEKPAPKGLPKKPPKPTKR